MSQSRIYAAQQAALRSEVQGMMPPAQIVESRMMQDFDLTRQVRAAGNPLEANALLGCINLRCLRPIPFGDSGLVRDVHYRLAGIASALEIGANQPLPYTATLRFLSVLTATSVIAEAVATGQTFGSGKNQVALPYLSTPAHVGNAITAELSVQFSDPQAGFEATLRWNGALAVSEPLYPALIHPR